MTYSGKKCKQPDCKGRIVLRGFEYRKDCSSYLKYQCDKCGLYYAKMVKTKRLEDGLPCDSLMAMPYYKEKHIE